MTRVLVVAAIVAQLADLATWSLAPHLESGALAPVPPPEVAITKVVGAALVIALSFALGRYPAMQAFVLVAVIAVGTFCAGTNAATVSIVRAAEVPRPAQQPSVPADGLAPAPPGAGLHPSPRRPTGTRPAGAVAALDRNPSSASLSGVASWFVSPAGVSAAGPRLRQALGRHWRGTRIRVCHADRCASTVLGDWMRRDRLVDLDDDVFRRVCGPLSMGLCRVRVWAGTLPETSTR